MAHGKVKSFNDTKGYRFIERGRKGPQSTNVRPA